MVAVQQCMSGSIFDMGYCNSSHMGKADFRIPMHYMSRDGNSVTVDSFEVLLVPFRDYTIKT